ncbi:MAG: STAS domain-containing protein [Planctomycetes bacterium]|nr:STAS domain-containing protein [Planctomycetota bacterium]
MSFDQNVIDGVTVVSIAGRLDVDAVEEIGTAVKKVAESPSVKLVLDLGEVSYMSSRGLSLLLELMHAAREAGGALRLAAVQPLVGEVLEISGARLLFNLHDTVEEAVGAFNTG